MPLGYSLACIAACLDLLKVSASGKCTNFTPLAVETGCDLALFQGGHFFNVVQGLASCIAADTEVDAGRAM